MADESVELLRLRAEAARAQMQMQAQARAQAQGGSGGGSLDGIINPRFSRSGRREEIQRGLRNVDDFVRSMANVLPWVDETTAGAAALTGVGSQAGPDASYEENLAAERARDEAIPPVTKAAGTVAGLALTLPMLSLRAPSLLRGAAPTVRSIAPKAAIEGAGYGALYGSGAAEGDTIGDRVAGGLEGLGVGALTGGAFGTAGGLLASRMSRASQAASTPTSQQILSKANESYEAARRSGVAIEPTAFSRLTEDLRRLAVREGFDPKLYGRVNKALKRMDEAVKSGKPIDFAEVDILRNFWRNAAGARDPQKGRLGGVLQRQFEDAIAGLDEAQTVGGNLVRAQTQQATANTLYRQGKSAQTIEDTLARARLVADGPNSQGLQKAIQGEFDKLLKNDRKMRFFSEAEKEIVRKVAQGGRIQDMVALVGRLAPSPSFNGVVGPLAASGLGTGAGLLFGGPAGAYIGGALPMAAGVTARGIGGRMANRAANRAVQSFRQGVSVPQATPQQSLPHPLLMQILRSAPAAVASQNPPLPQVP